MRAVADTKRAFRYISIDNYIGGWRREKVVSIFNTEAVVKKKHCTHVRTQRETFIYLCDFSVITFTVSSVEPIRSVVVFSNA